MENHNRPWNRPLYSPRANRGVETGTGPTGDLLSVRPDWLTVTGRIGSTGDALPLWMELQLGPCTQVPGNRHYQRAVASDDGYARLRYDGLGFATGTYALDVTGGYWAASSDPLAALALFATSDRTVTRLDLAQDRSAGPDPVTLHAAMKCHDADTHIRWSHYEDTVGSKGADGASVYQGAPASDFRHRTYDMRGYMRYEAQLRKRMAQEAVRTVLEAGSAEGWRQSVNRRLRFPTVPSWSVVAACA